MYVTDISVLVWDHHQEQIWKEAEIKEVLTGVQDLGENEGATAFHSFGIWKHIFQGRQICNNNCGEML